MKKQILYNLGILFIATSMVVSGCSKPEEKKAEAPAVEKQMVQEKAPVAQKEMVEKAEPALETAKEQTPTMTDQAVEAAKEMGQQALESASEKLPEEVKQAVETAKEYSGQMEQAAGEVKAPEMQASPPPPADAPASTEQMLKEKAVEQGMKLPGKY